MDTPSPYQTPDGSGCPSAGESVTGLELSKPSMFRSLSDIFGNVVPQEYNGLGFDGWPALLERAESDFENGKALRTVVSVLQYLKEKSPVTLISATKFLADGSRQGKLLFEFL